MYKLSYYRYVSARKLPCWCITIMDFLSHLFSFASRFAETDGKGFDRARRYEIGRKHFKLTHFEEVQCYYSSLQSFRNQSPPLSFAWLHLQRVHVPYCLMQVFTTQHWMVRIYKLKPQKNRVRGKLKLKLKSVSQTTLQLAYNHVYVINWHSFSTSLIFSIFSFLLDCRVRKQV